MTDSTGEFSGNLSTAPERATGNLDTVTFFDGVGRTPVAGRRVPRGSLLIVEGWALDRSGECGAGDVVVTVGPAPACAARVHLPRPDVALAYKSQELSAVGFRAMVPTELLEPGSYGVNFHVLDRARGVRFDWHESTTVDIGPAEEADPRATPGRMRFEIRSVGTDPPVRDADAAAARRVPETAVVLVEGWVIDAALEALAGEVRVLVDDMIVHRGLYGYDDDDAARRLGNPALRACGFKARVQTRLLDVGPHEVRIVALSGDGSAYDVSEPERFEIVPAFENAVLGTLTAQPTPARFEEFFTLGADDAIVPVSGGVRVERGRVLYVSGWAVDEPEGRAGSDAKLLVDDALLFDASYGAQRADVAAAFGDAAFLASGFVGAIATDELEPGAHALRCIVRSATGPVWRNGSESVTFEII